MKILFLIDTLGPGGAERSTALMVPMLRARGADVGVITLWSPPNNSEDATRAAGIEVTQLQSHSLLRRVLECRRIVRAERPDILHTALFAADQVGRLAAIGTRTKVVSSLVNVPRSRSHLTDGGPAAWKVSVADFFDAMTGHFLVDRFHAVTPGVARLHHQRFGLRSATISVVERGRPTDALGARTPERRARLRAELGLADDIPVILAAGRLEQQKAHVDLITAMQSILHAHPTAVLLIAGREGNASASVDAELDAHPEIAAHVRLLGHRDDVPDLLAACDVMVLPSRFEGTAGIALEAMALSTPIVATRLDGMEGILVDGRNVLICEVGDSAAIAAAVNRLWADPTLAARLGAAGREDFLARFTLDRAADRMLAMYTELTDRPTAAPPAPT